MAIKQPHNRGGLKWNPSFASSRNAQFQRQQKFVDSECLRYCDPLTPKKTGNLINSGKMGTTIGSGEIKYLAVYAAIQYYNTAESRPTDANRGGKWFERMKAAHKQAILEGVKKM